MRCLRRRTSCFRPLLVVPCGVCQGHIFLEPILIGVGRGLLKLLLCLPLKSGRPDAEGK